MATISKKGKKWQVQIRRVDHKPIFRTFKTKGEAKIFATDVEAKLDGGETITYDDMTIAGLVQAVREETDNGRLLTAAYRTSLNHIDRLLGLKWESKLSAKDIMVFAQYTRGTRTSRARPPVASASSTAARRRMRVLAGVGAAGARR